MACFHSNAAATGTIRNGAIINVRTMPRPRNDAVQQQRDAQAEDQADQHDGDGQQDGDPHRSQQVGVGEDLDVVVERADEDLVRGGWRSSS